MRRLLLVMVALMLTGGGAATAESDCVRLIGNNLIPFCYGYGYTLAPNATATAWVSGGCGGMACSSDMPWVDQTGVYTGVVSFCETGVCHTDGQLFIDGTVVDVRPSRVSTGPSGTIAVIAGGYGFTLVGGYMRVYTGGPPPLVCFYIMPPTAPQFDCD